MHRLCEFPSSPAAAGGCPLPRQRYVWKWEMCVCVHATVYMDIRGQPGLLVLAFHFIADDPNWPWNLWELRSFHLPCPHRSVGIVDAYITMFSFTWVLAYEHTCIYLRGKQFTVPPSLTFWCCDMSFQCLQLSRDTCSSHRLEIPGLHDSYWKPVLCQPALATRAKGLLRLSVSMQLHTLQHWFCALGEGGKEIVQSMASCTLHALFIFSS